MAEPELSFALRGDWFIYSQCQWTFFKSWVTQARIAKGESEIQDLSLVQAGEAPIGLQWNSFTSKVATIA